MLAIILSIIIVVPLLILLGFSFPTIFTYATWGLCILLGLALIAIALFFLGTSCSLLGFHRAKGKFQRFTHSEHFDRAVYVVDGTEYTCLFPAENYGRKRIYQSDETTVLIRDGKKHRIAYDRHSLLIVTVGTVFSLLSLIGIAIYLVALL